MQILQQYDVKEIIVTVPHNPGPRLKATFYISPEVERELTISSAQLDKLIADERFRREIIRAEGYYLFSFIRKSTNKETTMLDSYTKHLYLDGLRTTGDPVEAYFYHEEQLLMSDAKDLFRFALWLWTNKRSVGHGNFEEVFEEYQKTPVLFVANNDQKVLYECELKGQLSDGNWENSRPHNHYIKPCKAQVIVCDIGIFRGTNWKHNRKYNFADPFLLEVVGDRMLFWVRAVRRYPHLMEELDSHWSWKRSKAGALVDLIENPSPLAEDYSLPRLVKDLEELSGYFG